MKQTIREVLRVSFPVLVGYLFLGIAFGLLCEKQGYSMLWAFFISFFVYAGSIQFVLLSFLSSGMHLMEVMIITLSVNARQIFYGLSFLHVFTKFGWKKWYMIFSLTDETYSLLCCVPDKEAEHGRLLMFLISLFDQMYWVLGSIIGASVGALMTFDTRGIDFAMTALFTVLFVEQYLATKNHLPVWIAGISILLAVIFFQLENFLLPSLMILVILLTIFEQKVEQKGDR